MTGKTHFIFGGVVGLIFAMATQAALPDAALMVITGAIGGLVPDIDSPNSTISKKARPARLFLWWIPHRTLTHSILATLGVGLFAYLAGIFATAFLAGYVSHVAADMTTKRGVPLFYPFWSRQLHLLPPGFRLTTGGLVETAFAVVITILGGYLGAQFLGVL